jgi:hypothetical protein
VGTPNDSVKRDILPIPDPKAVGLTSGIVGPTEWFQRDAIRDVS